MNYYAEAIEICSKDQDWKKIAINIAKKHPKLFLDAVQADKWKTVALGYLGRGHKIKAIKYCLDTTGMSVEEAKKAVEAL